MELSKKQELNIAIKLINIAMKEEPEEASFERLTAWCSGYLCCSTEEAMEILCKIGDIIVSMTNEEANNDQKNMEFKDPIL